MVVVLLAATNNCQFTTTNQIVRGGSLTPLIPNGASVVLQESYYKCNAIKREDVVELLLGGQKIIKIVKGLPGDVIALWPSHEEWNILINGSVVKNSQGKTYTLSKNQVQIMRLYAQDYPVIPRQTYLVLGDVPTGSFDSTRVGLIPAQYILGNIMYDSHRP